MERSTHPFVPNSIISFQLSPERAPPDTSHAVTHWDFREAEVEKEGLPPFSVPCLPCVILRVLLQTKNTRVQIGHYWIIIVSLSLSLCGHKMKAFTQQWTTSSFMTSPPVRDSVNSRYKHLSLYFFPVEEPRGSSRVSPIFGNTPGHRIVSHLILTSAWTAWTARKGTTKPPGSTSFRRTNDHSPVECPRSNPHHELFPTFGARTRSRAQPW